LDYGGVRANLRVITRKSHICADKSKDKQRRYLANVLNVCQLKNDGEVNFEFRKSPASFSRVMRTCC